MADNILVPLIVFATIFGIVYVFLTTRNKERLSLIEKGADASLFNSNRKFFWKNFTLSSGMLLVGIGIGIMIGALLSKSIPLEESIAYPMSIFTFAGLSLIIYYFVARKMDKTDKEQ
ncbi:MAG TPA: hypothetical protein ENG85_02870 [Bacteroidetes bacterium]|nr:hypothetical protein [Bacteroidota bacterium]